MNQQTLVERIVAEVMRQLAPAASTVPVSAATEEPAAAGAPAGTAAEPDVPVRLSGPVITADSLAGNAAGQRLVGISSRAIVTPAARDWLKQNGVELVRVAESEEHLSGSRFTWRAVVQTADRQAQAVLEEAGGSGLFCHVLWHVADAPTAAQAAVQAVTGHEETQGQTGVVVLSAEPETVACLANRHVAVRAAAVADAAAVDRVKSGLNGNVFVVDPAGRSGFEIRNLLKKITE